MTFPALAECSEGVGAKRHTVRANSGQLIEIPTVARARVMPQADILPDNPEPPPWFSDPEVNLQPVNTAATFKATGSAWGRKTEDGRGLGLAFHHSFVSYTAIVFDVEVDDEGQLTIHRADIAFDCGPQAHRERLRSQLEGACVMGIGIAMQNEVTFEGGVAQQGNFDTYLVPRMPDAPKVLHVHLIDNPDDAMGGAGEPGLPPVAPALCNAIHAATGKRIRRLPVGDQLSG